MQMAEVVRVVRDEGEADPPLFFRNQFPIQLDQERIGPARAA
jgi:hypothetical protein